MAGSEDFEGGTVGVALTTGTGIDQIFLSASSTARTSDVDPYAGTKHGRLHVESGYALCGFKALGSSSYRVFRTYFTLNDGVPNFSSGSYIGWHGTSAVLTGWVRLLKQTSTTYRLSIGRGGSTDSSPAVDLNVGQQYRIEYVYDGPGGHHYLYVWTGATLESSDDGDAIIAVSAVCGNTAQSEFWIGLNGAPSDAVVGNMDYDGLAWAESARLGPLGSMYTESTEVTPAGFDNDPPPDLAALIALDLTITPTTRWDEGQSVTLGDASTAYWDGDEWIAGVAPGPTWTPGTGYRKILNDLAGAAGLGEAAAANDLAGTSGLEVVGALNAFNGTVGVEHEAALRTAQGEATSIVIEAKVNPNLMTVARSFEDASDFADDLGNIYANEDGFTAAVVADTSAPHGGNVLRVTSPEIGTPYIEFPYGNLPPARDDLTTVEFGVVHTAHVSVRPSVTTTVELGLYCVLDDGSDWGDFADWVDVVCPAGEWTDITLPFTADEGEANIVMYVDMQQAEGSSVDIDKVGIWVGTNEAWRL